ncbi:hypothetical protein CTI12_AA289680 [Artemisia annua]|uniref:Uncharacterized protein n=1 Tax=Artemisia annua TaxID=35608 RepID=A0A2U1N9V3_ARTAN|nr:hypothetical protein CTI12_AA289680 [Artemisia annua]
MLGEENIPMPPPMVNGTTDVINDNNVSAGGHVEPVSCASPATDANVIEPGLESGNVLNESQVEKDSTNVHVVAPNVEQLLLSARKNFDATMNQVQREIAANKGIHTDSNTTGYNKFNA